MLTTIRRRLTGESGQALVEFALVFPFILLPLIIGAFDLSTAYHRWNEQTNLAEQGARYAAVGSWPGSPGASLASYLCTNLTATDKDLVNGQHPTISIKDLTSSTNPAQGDPIQVDISSTYSFPFVGRLISAASKPLDSNATMRSEIAPPANELTSTRC